MALHYHAYYHCSGARWQANELNDKTHTSHIGRYIKLPPKTRASRNVYVTQLMTNTNKHNTSESVWPPLYYCTLVLKVTTNSNHMQTNTQQTWMFHTSATRDSWLAVPVRVNVSHHTAVSREGCKDATTRCDQRPVATSRSVHVCLDKTKNNELVRITLHPSRVSGTRTSSPLSTAAEWTGEADISMSASGN